MRKPPRLLVLGALLSTIGCYTYQPAPARLVEPGTDVRVHLNEGREVELSSVTVRDVMLVEGQLTDWTNDNDAVVFTTNVQTRPGIRQETQGELVSIAERSIQSMEAPKLSGGRTAAMVAIGAGILVALVAGISSRGNAGDDGDGGNGPDPGEGGFVKIPLMIFGR